MRIERNISFHVFRRILLHNFIESYANMAGRYYPLRTCSVSSMIPNTVPNLAEWCTTFQQGVGESTKPHSTETRDNIIKSRSKRPPTANSSDSDCAGEKLARSHILVEDCKGLRWQIGHRYGCAGQSASELVYIRSGESPLHGAAMRRFSHVRDRCGAVAEE